MNRQVWGETEEEKLKVLCRWRTKPEERKKTPSKFKSECLWH